MNFNDFGRNLILSIQHDFLHGADAFSLEPPWGGREPRSPYASAMQTLASHSGDSYCMAEARSA